MKKIISIILSVALLISLLPTVTFAEENNYSDIFSWNFTKNTFYKTSKVSQTSATCVSWGDYRSAFMVFAIPDDLTSDEWIITDDSLVFDNGRTSNQAPTVTLRLVDGDVLHSTYSDYQSGTLSAAEATEALKSLCDTGKAVGTFDTLSSNNSSRLYIGEHIRNEKQTGKTYIGFHLTCREEDSSFNSGIVNFVNPVFSPAPEIGEVINLQVDLSPVLLKQGETKTITPVLSPSDARITNTECGSDVIKLTFTDTSITVTASATGFAVVNLTVSYEDKTMTKSFSVSVTENNIYELLPSVTLFENGIFAKVIMDESYQNTLSYNQIKRATGDLKQDMALLSGKMNVDEIPMDDSTEKKNLRLDSLNLQESTSTAVIIGSIEESQLIQNLITEGRLDEGAQIKGNWESYVIKKVKNPIDGIENALVIAGSDTRGTIYGIYTLSEMMGISPWYWWSDVAIDTCVSFSFTEDTIINKGPSVQYRGIFINDEEHFVEWCEHHFPDDYAMDSARVNGPNKYIYSHMFELLLRLGANTLWPAMHEYTTAFNYDLDENSIPLNAKAAAEYGIVMSSSHCEIMLRNNVGEWANWYSQNKSKYNIQGSNSSNAYDFTLNKEAILAYWKERLVSNKDFESIFVLGIRGVHDGAPKYSNLSGAGYGSGTDGIVNMMKDVISEQRKMIKEIYGSEDAVPQVFIPYKEMNTYYNHNNGDLASWLPNDIIVMYAEDNQNYLRQTSTALERARSGGLGIYYHNSYWGTPKSYLWLNSTPTTLMYEEMKKAYDTGAEKYWILNVGDLKPGELNMEFFLRMAWDVDKYDDTNIYSDYYKNQAIRDYRLNEEDATLYGEILKLINQLVMVKKAEFFGYSVSSSATVPYFPSGNIFPYSITEHGDEGQIFVDKWNYAADTLSTLYEKLDEEYKNSFYEQIYHFTLSYRNRNEEYVYYWKNKLYAEQGRYASAKAYADLSRNAVSRIKSDQEYYGLLNDGKWSKILNYEHIIYYQHNQGALLVNDSMYSTATPSEGVGAVCEGQSLPSDDVTLLFNSLADNTRFIDVFGKNIFEESYVIEKDDFILLSASEGSVYTEERIIASIDWSSLPLGETSGTINVYNADEKGEKVGDAVASFKVKATKTDLVPEDKTYSEANGFVSIRAEHYTDTTTASDGSSWAVVDNLGQAGSSVKGFPDLAEKGSIYNKDSAAQLTYRIYFETAGTFNGTLYRLPTLSEGSENGEARSCNIAIGLKGEEPELLTGNRNTSGSWGANVMRGYEPLPFSVTIPESGYYDLVVYKIDSSIAFDRIVIETTSVDSSHTGPSESPHSFGENSVTVTGNVPEYVSSIIPPASISPLGNLTVGTGTKNTIAVDKSSDTAVSFTSLDPSVAYVEYSVNTLTIYGLKKGETTIIAESEKEGTDKGRQEFPVMVTDNSSDGYTEENGALVINPSDALSNTDFAYATNTEDFEWVQSGSGIAVSPNKGTNWTNASNLSSAPYTSFVVKFNTAGTYYASVNLSCPDDSSDSFHFGLDDTIVFSSNTKNNRAVTKTEEWFSHSSWVINIPSAGKYTIKLYPREDGLCVNQIYLSQTERMDDGSTGNLKATHGENPNLIPQTLTEEERFNLDIRFALSGYDLQNITESLDISEVLPFSTNVKWKSSDESILSDGGAVTLPENDTLVTLTATFTLNGLIKQKSYSLTVKAPEKSYLSESGFVTHSFNPFSGKSYITFSLTAFSKSDGVIGICESTKNPSAYSDYSICIRIRPDGTMDAHNGSAFTKIDEISYEENIPFFVIIEADASQKSYSAYTLQNGEMKTLAKDYSFRASANDLGKISFLPGSGVAAGLFKIHNLVISTMPYRISDLSLCESTIDTSILYFGEGISADSIVISHYNADNSLISAQRTPLSLSFGEILPFNTELIPNSACINLMITDSRFAPLCVNKKLSINS